MKKSFYIYIFVLVFLLFFIFYIVGSTKITVKFKDLEPLKHTLPVYYKGFKLGHTTKIYPSSDYQTTLVDTRIVLKKIVLPSNTTAILKRKEKRDYIELIYPQEPSDTNLRHKDVIEGKLGANFEHFLQEQASNGGLDEIKENLNTTIISLGQTFDALTDVAITANDILKDVRPELKSAAQNLNYSSQNLTKISGSIDNTLEKGYFDSFLYGLNETSGNLVITTKNLNQESSGLLNCLLKRLNIVVSNINQIVVGVGETLKKRFGGLRLIFGKIE